jgi:7-cyano-7-deazaguanine synthase
MKMPYTQRYTIPDASPKDQPFQVVTLFSGGLDSVTLAHFLHFGLGFDRILLLSFDYGQRHAIELIRATRIAARLSHLSGLEQRDSYIRHSIVSLKDVTSLINGSSLTGSDDVPEGHYADENMKSTVVPNRNAMMINIAYAAALNYKASYVMYAAHAGDHAVYPDCRVEFVNAMNFAMRTGSAGMFARLPQLDAPFIHDSKADIVKLGASPQLKVPFHLTWSCYQGGTTHCGRCGTCVERKEAFALANVQDPTEYEDAEFLIKANR